VAKFELPPPEHRVASVESWKAPMVQPPPSLGPPPLLMVLLLAEIALALLSLWRWEPEELLIPGCPPIQALFSMIFAFYAYRGRNAARILGFVSAGFWIIAGIIAMRSRTDLLDPLPTSTRAILYGRASFEVLFALYLTRPEVARYFEQPK
jgi:hypothetical protein